VLRAMLEWAAALVLAWLLLLGGLWVVMVVVG
jgi:hypothetical protein